MIHRVKATINLSALNNNLKVARSHAKNRKVVAVIKGNAYGHGLIPVAEALQDADTFGVTDVDEADLLAASGNTKPILILQGIIERADINRIAKVGYQVVIHHFEQLAWLEKELAKINLTKPLSIWLKMNSGMGRLGITPTDYVKTYQNLQNKAWCKEVILMTHLANANLIDSDLNQHQLSTFSKITQELPDSATSIPASSGLLAGIGDNTDWVRPGIMLYGSSPFPFSDEHLRREAFGLHAVMTLQSNLISIQNCKAGDNVGYCSQFICPQDMRIGIVSIGYADGYPSNAPNGTPVLINGKRTVTVGRVSMDMIGIDLSDLAEAKIGDTVTLWDDELSLDEVAEHTGILSYNLTCSIAQRVEKAYSN
ncbi:MAG: alanine racemase [Gammaproteobacteria bacterium]|nr:alanine racemase [Gammaproteobacteria bacterium]